MLSVSCSFLLSVICSDGILDVPLWRQLEPAFHAPDEFHAKLKKLSRSLDDIYKEMSELNKLPDNERQERKKELQRRFDDIEKELELAKKQYDKSKPK